MSTPSTTSSSAPTDQASSGRLSAVILLAQVSERAFTVVFTIIVAKQLGAGRELDMALLALAIPTGVGIVLETIAYVGLLPFFAAEGASQGRDAQWGLVNRTFNSLGLIFAALTAVHLAASPWTTRLMSSGASPAEVAAIVSLAWPAALVMWLRGLGGILSAFLMSRNAVWPAFGRLGIRGLARVAFFALLVHLGWRARAFVVATVASEAVAVAVCLPGTFALKSPSRYRLPALLPLHRLGSILSQVGNQAIISGLNSSFMMLERGVAGSLAVGSVAVVNYARSLGLLPLMVGRSMVAGLYPRFARDAAAGESAFGRTVWLGLRATLFATIPAAVSLVVLRQPIIALFYQRGEFTSGDVNRVAALLPYYLVACVFSSLFYLGSRSLFSAMQSAPVAARQAISWVVYVAVLVGLTPRFGIVVVGVAFLVQACVSAALVLIAARQRRLIEPRRPVRYALATAAAAALVACGTMAGYWVLARVVPGTTTLATGVHVAGGLLGSILAYVPVALTVHRREAEQVRALIRRRRRG